MGIFYVINVPPTVVDGEETVDKEEEAAIDMVIIEGMMEEEEA